MKNIPVMIVDVKNGNNRLYPKSVVQEAIQRFNNLSRPRNGELGSPSKLGTIDPEQVSHTVTDMWMDKDTVLINVEVLATPAGDVLKELLALSNPPGGFRTRGCISHDSTGTISYFQLIAIDYVSAPVDLCKPRKPRKTLSSRS